MNTRSLIFFQIISVLVGALFIPASIYAGDESSDSFISRDAVISTGGTYATSSSYQLIITEGQTVTGQSTSNAYVLNTGFLYYPAPVTTVTPTTPTTNPTVSSGGGGGGGGGILNSATIASTGIVISGRAFPLAKIKILDNTLLATSTVADTAGNFTAKYTVNKEGVHNISISSTDSLGITSGSQFYQMTASSNFSGGLSNVWLSPTLTTNKSEVKIGDKIEVSGFGLPFSKTELEFTPKISSAFPVETESSGKFSLLLATGGLNPGEYFVRARLATSTTYSSWTDNLRFVIGVKNVTRVVDKASTGVVTGDLSGDGKVDMKDFSILAYWFKRASSPAFADLEKRALGGTGTVTLRDFSILAYHWSP